MLVKFPPIFTFTSVLETLKSVFDFWGGIMNLPTSVTKKRCEICKAWNDIITVLAESRGGFTAFLKYFSGFAVSYTPKILTFRETWLRASYMVPYFWS